MNMIDQQINYCDLTMKDIVDITNINNMTIEYIIASITVLKSIVTDINWKNPNVAPKAISVNDINYVIKVLEKRLVLLNERKAKAGVKAQAIPSKEQIIQSLDVKSKTKNNLDIPKLSESSFATKEAEEPKIPVNIKPHKATIIKDLIHYHSSIDDVMKLNISKYLTKDEASMVTDTENFIPIKLHGKNIIDKPIPVIRNGNNYIMDHGTIRVAFKITKIQEINIGFVIRSIDEKIAVLVDASFIMKFRPQVGGYYVTYINEYRSYVSQKTFEETIFIS